MEETKELLKHKINVCLSEVSGAARTDRLAAAAEAVEHLAKAYYYLDQIKEDEK